MNQAALKREPTSGPNGVDVPALKRAIGAIMKQPELAKFHFRARNTWMGGDHNRSTIQDFYGVGTEQTTRTEPYVLDNGEPAALIGNESGANPVEYLLNALVGCMTTTMVYHAASRGIEIEAVDSELEGDIDIRGFLGLSEDVRKGYQVIRVKMRVRSDAPAEILAGLTQFSPVYDVVSRSVPVELSLDTY